MRSVLTFTSRVSEFVCKTGMFTIVCALFLASNVDAKDITVSEKDFTCIRDGHKIRNTYIRNSDPEKLKEAMRMFQDSVPEHKFIYGPSLRDNSGVSRDAPLENRAASIYPASRWTMTVSGT